MRGASRITAWSGPLDAYWRAVHLSNVTGLASLKHYEAAFAGLGRDSRANLCGWVPFLFALRNAGIECEGLATVGLYPPNAELPPKLRQQLLEIEEVVEASGTQVLEMRESEGPRAEQFTISARQEFGITLVALGDASGTKMRSMAWSADGAGWSISSFALEQAACHGWPRAAYQYLHQQHPGRVPSPKSVIIRGLTAGRPEGGTDAQSSEPPWITFLEMAELIGGRIGPARSDPVESGQRRANPSMC